MKFNFPVIQLLKLITMRRRAVLWAIAISCFCLRITVIVKIQCWWRRCCFEILWNPVTTFGRIQRTW